MRGTKNTTKKKARQPDRLNIGHNEGTDEIDSLGKQVTALLL